MLNMIGINLQHAYSVLGTYNITNQTYDGQTGTFVVCDQLILLRNSYGSSNYNGTYANISDFTMYQRTQIPTKLLF